MFWGIHLHFEMRCFGRSHQVRHIPRDQVETERVFKRSVYCCMQVTHRVNCAPFLQLACIQRMKLLSGQLHKRHFTEGRFDVPADNISSRVQ